MLGSLFSKKVISTEPVLEVPVPDCIPYACHYNDDTLLTKNGELIQVIKIMGFTHESLGSEDLDLRQMIRKAVQDNVRTSDFALWFHTVRRRRSLNPGGEYPQGFAKALNKAWNDKHQWESTFVNEVFVSVIRDGKSARLRKPSDITQSMYFGLLKRSHTKFLEESSSELQAVVDGMLETLKPFGAKRLSIIQKEDGFYSEQLQFLTKILNLAETEVPVPINDISEYLATHKIAFGFNLLEVVGSTGKHFGTIFMMKEYHELTGKALDLFLQLPQEFIITQTLDFISSKTALREFQAQKRLLDISGDRELLAASGLDQVIASDQGGETDFGETQISILLINDHVKQLESNINEAVEMLNYLGVVATRADLRLEEAFWARLPGNFAYLPRNRLKSISTSKVAGMASLYNFPAGRLIGNYWGPAAVIFHTAKRTPYFFNFHDQDNGHTTIVGPYGSGKTVLTNFLVAAAQKYGGRLFFFDQMRASKVFVRALGGYYTVIKPGQPSPKNSFNPLSIPDTPVNRTFLKKWMVYLAWSAGAKLTDADKALLLQAVDYSYTLPPEHRRLSVITRMFQGDLGQRMAIWHSDGKYAHLFDNDVISATALTQHRICGFGMSFVLKDKVTLAPVLSYLFHCIEMTLDGTPTIVVLDEAWNLINNNIFAPGLSEWLDRLRERNAMVIFATQNLDNASKSPITRTITQKIATQIFLPDYEADKYNYAYKEIWGLSDAEYRNLMAMREDKRQFMLRQGGTTIVAELNLAGMKELRVLSGSDKTVEVMDEAITATGPNVEQWLPMFYRICRDRKI